jgi:hypothetical protein
MSKSKAQKKREKLVREGRINPEISRSPYATLDLSTRRTKTKKDHLYRMKHKNRHPKHEENGSFYFAVLQSLQVYVFALDGNCAVTTVNISSLLGMEWV